MKNIVAQRENETKCSLSLRKLKVSDLEKIPSLDEKKYSLEMKNTVSQWENTVSQWEKKNPYFNKKMYLSEKNGVSQLE